MRHPPKEPALTRFAQGARLRRTMVYVLAAVLVTVAGVMAVEMSMPADPHASVRVEHLPGTRGGDAAETQDVRFDPGTGTTAIDVRHSDGVVRRYFLREHPGEVRIWGGDMAPPD